MFRLKQSASVCVLVLTAALAAHAQSAESPPGQQPVAVEVGQDACVACHAEVGAQFQRNVHARLAEFETRRRGRHAVAGCEACHGAGSRHAESGDPSLMFSFKKEEAREINEACLSCHRESPGHEWNSSDHALTGMSCADCHRIHQSRRTFTGADKQVSTLTAIHADAPPPRYSLVKPEPQLCLECHREKTAQMLLTSHHPVREGKMQCSSCHQVHGSPEGQLRTEERASDLCLKCHTAKQGPFVFEHPPVAENCLTCHEPHGTIANNLLRQNEPFLCLQCHEAHFHIGRSGATSAVTLPSGGSTNPYGEKGWRTAFGTKCTECHSQIHGSDLPGQSVPGRGRSLVR
jgi:predicted CXXCH cytochrome family protein